MGQIGRWSRGVRSWKAVGAETRAGNDEPTDCPLFPTSEVAASEGWPGLNGSSSGAARNTWGHRARVGNSADHSNDDGIHGCFRSRSQEVPRQPLQRPPNRDRLRHSAVAAGERVLVARNSPSNPDRSQTQHSPADRQDSNQHRIRCRRPAASQKSILGNGLSFRYIIASAAVIQSESLEQSRISRAWQPGIAETNGFPRRSHPLAPSAPFGGKFESRFGHLISKTVELWPILGPIG